MNWNHNVHYHRFVTSQVPPNCKRALDVGCGRGALTQRLARLSQQVVGIDADPGCLAQARIAYGGLANIAFVEGDCLTESFPTDSFDFIVAVAALHHLPLRRALERFRALLRPGGVLVIVGLYKISSPIDYAYSAIAMPMSLAFRSFRGKEDVGAPLQDPRETLATIRNECGSALPGSSVRRRLFYRYSLVWQRPTDN
jgi:SAM-dependent methyltransferase